VKVGINAHVLGTEVGGDKNYVRNVIRSVGAMDPDGDYTLFLGQPLPLEPILGAERMRRVVVEPYNPLIRMPITFPLALARERIDVVHVQYIAPPICSARIVVTVHDISYERYPHFFAPEAITQLRALVPLTIRHAATVLTVSEFSRQDIIRRYCVAQEKVVVAHGSADPVFHPIHDPAQFSAARERYGTGEQFILCVGNLQPRKNLVTLINAYVRLRQADATRHKLVLVGGKSWLYDDIFAAARDSGYIDDLVFTGFVPDDDLVALYNAAELFVYPSLFEGFGAPPLEAMACGTPVVTTNTSSIPEVVGDAALLVDPLDVEGMARAMAAVLDDHALRARLSARGLDRASAFSWDAAARTIVDVYRRAARWEG
jgi:glycosyltransferase involved in cell wall biosynthesis